LGTTARVSRITELIKLVTEPNIQINVIVKDLGGSTDASPTQELFLTIYSKGDVFSTDATFDLGKIYDFKSARKIYQNIYEISVVRIDDETSLHQKKLLTINGEKAINDILKVKCTSLNCPDSDEFESTIIVNEK
jgi:hypothetical protein